MRDGTAFVGHGTDLIARLSRNGYSLAAFTRAPTDMPYGRGCGLRDPSGNQLRLAQLAPQFAAA
jgi:hypothetical protein